MSVEKDIRSFILENYLFTDDESTLQNNDSFLDKGVLDSTGILELIFHIEESYGIKVQDEEMIPENLDSVSRVVAYVGTKQSSAA